MSNQLNQSNQPYNIEANYVISDKEHKNQIPLLQVGLDEGSHRKPSITGSTGVASAIGNKEPTRLEAIDFLLDTIVKEKDKTQDRIFLVSAAYDKIYSKYNSISLFVLILSSISTLLEAFRLTLIEFIDKGGYNIDINTIQFVMNSTILTTGTIITVLSSIVRFRNYRETLEQLKDSRAFLINYRDKYNKKYQKVLNLLAFDSLDRQEIKDIQEKIHAYDDDIKSVNILQYLRNKDILKFTKYKAFFDYEMKKIESDKKKAVEKYEKKDKTQESINTDTIGKLKKILNLQKLQRIKKYLFQKNDNNIISL